MASPLGAEDLLDCVTHAESDVHWLLRNPAPLERIVPNVKRADGTPRPLAVVISEYKRLRAP